MRIGVAALVAFIVVIAAASARPAAREANCARTSTGNMPLVELGSRKYAGFAGGLYPGSRSSPPAAYLRRGKAAAARIVPRAGDGSPSASGAIVLLSIGMSNATQEFSAFKARADTDPRRNPRVILVDGAQSGWAAQKIKDPAAPFWKVVDARLARARATARQVQAVWIKEALARPNEVFPADAKRLQADLRAIVDILRARFPNLRLVYLSSRTYGGYATTPLNPEPYAYQSGFAVKWLVEEATARPPRRPWLAWGPYLWTDGRRGRSDGLVWTCDDVAADGTHPSPSGRQKVAALLARFFASNPTARVWYLAR